MSLALLLIAACTSADATDVARKATGAVLGQVRVANTGGEGVYVRRTPRLTDRIKAWPEGTLLSVVGADVDGDGRRWKHVLDPGGNVGYVPGEFLQVVSPGVDPTEAERLAREAERLAREAAEYAERERLPEKFAAAVTAFFQQLLGSPSGAGPTAPPKPAGTPLRVAVLLPGISTDSAEEFRAEKGRNLGQVYSLLKGASGYDDIIYFSYNCGIVRRGDARPEWSPAAYVYTDTYKALGTSVGQVGCLISAYQNGTSRPVQFDLIGHSLGGALAFRYVATGGAGVARVVTLDSPVNGANPFTGEVWDQIQARYSLLSRLDWAADRREQARRASEMVKSPAATELRAYGQDPEQVRAKNFETVQALRRRGTAVRTYVNPRDVVVAGLDAGISGFERTFTRGADLDRIIWPFDIPWFNGAMDNHGLITRVLDRDDAARDERTALCADLEIRCS